MITASCNNSHNNKLHFLSATLQLPHNSLSIVKCCSEARVINSERIQLQEVCVGRIGRKRDYSECRETKRKEIKKRENINVVLEVSIFVLSRMMSSSPSSLRPFTKYNPSVLSKPTFQRAKFFRNFNPVSNINQFS